MHMMAQIADYMRRLLFSAVPPALCLLIAAAAPSFAQTTSPDVLQTTVESDSRQIALFVTGKGVASPFAVIRTENGSKSGTATLGSDTPVRIASNTKTFVAATVLRLEIRSLIKRARARLRRRRAFTQGLVRRFW